MTLTRKDMCYCGRELPCDEKSDGPKGPFHGPTRVFMSDVVCPVCKSPWRHGLIDCPSGRNGCAVAHHGEVPSCDCGISLERIKNFHLETP